MITTIRRPLIAASVGFAAGLAVLAAGAAHAQSRSSQVTIQNGYGTTTVDRNVSGQPGNRYGDTTVTGPNGQTYTREYSRSWDPTTQTYNRNSTATGPNGYSRSVQGSGQRTAPGQWSGTRTITRPNGSGRTVNRNVTRY